VWAVSPILKPQNWGTTLFHLIDIYVHKFILSVRPSVRPSVCPYITLCNLETNVGAGNVFVMGEANLILITNFAVAKMVSGQSQFLPRRKKANTVSYNFLTDFIVGYVFRLLEKRSSGV